MRVILFRPFQPTPEQVKVPFIYGWLRHPLWGWLGLRPVFAQHTLVEHEALTKWAKGRKSIVEIGVAEGASALALRKGMDPSGILFKSDTQGYDLEVLKGAEPVLPRIAALQIEVAFIPLYAGVPSWHEVISWCEGRRFGLYGLFPVLRDPRGQLVEADAILVRMAKQSIREHALSRERGG